MRLAVVGAGAAGLAAAWAARREGVEVTLVHDRPGATALSSGALDMCEWSAPDVAREIDARSLVFATSLGIWQLGTATCSLATQSGVVRSARGRDTAILDLEPLAGRRVAVAALDRGDWDGETLARVLSSSAWTRRTGTQFMAVHLDWVQSEEERRMSSYDFARRLSEPKRRASLAKSLANTACEGWLLGPWLGEEPEVAEQLREGLHQAVGETTSAPGEVAGARFEKARNRLIEASEIQAIQAQVRRVYSHAGCWNLDLCSAPGIEVDAVILALGGVAGGGVQLDHSRLAGGSGSFQLSLEAPVPLVLNGTPTGEPSSLAGIDFAQHGLGALERVGAAHRDHAILHQPGLYVAGDLVAARPRTILEAVQGGIRAALRALGDR